MKSPLIFCLALALSACGDPSRTTEAAQDTPMRRVAIEDAWAAPTPVGVDVSAGYLTIANGSGQADRLLSATSPRAERLEIHEMSMSEGVMQMRPTDSLVVGAGQETALAPGGAHLMFYGVAEPFAEGQEVPIQLTFEHAGTIDVLLPVRRAGAGSHSTH